MLDVLLYMMILRVVGKWSSVLSIFTHRIVAWSSSYTDGEGRVALLTSLDGPRPLFQNANGERLGLETELKRVIHESCKRDNFPELCDRV